MIELIFELIGSFLVEFLGQLLIELMAEIGLRSIGSSVGIGKDRHPILSIIGYALLGAIGGILSLLAFKEHFIKNQSLRIINLVLTPILVGTLMSLRGKRLISKGKSAIRLDTFAYGFLFALSFAIVRHMHAW